MDIIRKLSHAQLVRTNPIEHKAATPIPAVCDIFGVAADEATETAGSPEELQSVLPSIKRTVPDAQVEMWKRDDRGRLNKPAARRRVRTHWFGCRRSVPDPHQLLDVMDRLQDAGTEPTKMTFEEALEKL